jgi:hypothetical protein
VQNGTAKTFTRRGKLHGSDKPCIGNGWGHQISRMIGMMKGRLAVCLWI